MALTQPATYVLYRERGGEQAAWPGITVPDDVAPQHIRCERPSGYMTLILLFGNTYRFRWATTSQLSPFVPIAYDAQHTLAPELLQAFQTADICMDACLSLDYWREEVAFQVEDDMLLGQEAKSGPGCIDLDCDEEEINKAECEAMRISLEQSRNQGAGKFPTPSSSPPAQQKRKRNRTGPFVISEDDTEDDHDSLYSWPSKRKSPAAPQCVSPPRLGSNLGQSSSNVIRNKTFPSSARTSAPTCGKIRSATKNKNSRYRPTGPVNLDQLLRQGQNTGVPPSDNIDGDISKSKEFIRIFVGPEREVLTLLKTHVWNRPYFRDPRSATNRFELNEDNVWELSHPELAKLDPTDFQFLAEYLTAGDFGLRFPEGPEQTKEAIAQCVSAWEAGDKLGMFDLLEHIVQKVQYFEWDDADVLILAVIVYRTPDQPTPAHESMRDWLSGYLAQHFWAYIGDNTLGKLFRRRLRAIPDLERQVLEKRAAMLASGAELSEDEGSDGDGL